MKRLYMFLGIFTLLFALAACQDQPSNVDDDDNKRDEMLQLTIEELAMYNGKDGKDAYIAVDGVIYDVTGNPAWTGGSHNGNMAGTDVSDVISSAPHGDSVLDDLDVVGEIVENKDATDKEMLKLTIEELAMYDGKDGMDAYIAVDGVIYDVTGVPAWTGGSHNGNMAGTDVSDVISSAPHGDSVLDNLDVVGEIVENTESTESTDNTGTTDTTDNSENTDTSETTDSELLQLTIEELAMYDGKDGMDAYVAVNGVIYDVTGIAAWTGGSHNGNMAGTDVSNAINFAPHGASVLDGLEVVGEIVE